MKHGVAKTIAEIDEKMAVIKHALNLSNATAKVRFYAQGAPLAQADGAFLDPWGPLLTLLYQNHII